MLPIPLNLVSVAKMFPKALYSQSNAIPARVSIFLELFFFEKFIEKFTKNSISSIKTKTNFLPLWFLFRSLDMTTKLLIDNCDINFQYRNDLQNCLLTIWRHI
jgi:hypothetical protein